MLAIGLPTLAVATWLARRGSWRGLVVAIGALAYLAYNGFLLLFATPFNPLFLVYVAAMSLTAFALATTILTTDHDAVADHAAGVPARGIAMYIWVVRHPQHARLARTIVPAMFATDPTSFLEGSGVATNPVFVEDLDVLAPGGGPDRRLALGSPAGRHRPRRRLARLRPDRGDRGRHRPVVRIGRRPGSTQASMGAVALFVMVALIGLVPLFFYFRRDYRPGLNTMSQTATRSTSSTTP